MPEEIIVKDRISELAEKKLEQMKAAEQAAKEAKEKKAKEKATAESKGAAADELSTETDKKEKTEGAEKEAGEKIQEKSDVELLKAEDKDLTEPEKTKKTELLKKAEEPKTPEQKIKEWQDNTQKRIDEVMGELKAEREGRRSDFDVIKNLEGRIATMQAELEKSGTIESESAKDYKTDKERYEKTAAEDKDLPRVERREMSDDELEEYLLENHREANEWLVRRELRRRDEILERQKSRQAAQTIKQGAEAFFKEFPGCNQEARHKEIVSQGKTDAQAIEILMSESADFKLMMNIIKENPSFTNPDTGPKLLAAEMKKRKTAKPSTEKEVFTKEDVEMAKKQAAEAERQRLASIDTGLTSSVTTEAPVKGSPIYQEGLKLFIHAGKRRGQHWTEKDYQDTLDYGKRNQTKDR